MGSGGGDRPSRVSHASIRNNNSGLSKKKRMTFKSSGSSGAQKVEVTDKRTRSKLSGNIGSTGGGSLKMGSSNSACLAAQAPKIIQKKIKLGCFGVRKSETSQDSLNNRGINSIRSQHMNSASQ